MKWKKVKENNIHSKERHKYSTFFCSTFVSHTHIYIYIYDLCHTQQTLSPSIHPPTPLRPFFFYLLFMFTKGELGGGGGFFLHRKTFHEFDRYHTKANTELGEEEEKDKSFISTQLEIHKILYKKNCL